ncbi:Dyp-type peroxidase [Dermatobacter hominis]|uniref:Dyp-type peroxidase n=1 Tax=Dermatobacter hominis TaxID=2884263 RepID=UPI001D11B38F|nr:Dyp-type peroxidase [Dermatobacter hominis]UDY37975.1 Dyp-type peroxidase [Dermatobacter hominis]
MNALAGPLGSVVRTARARLGPRRLSRATLADIQGNVLRAFDDDHAELLLVAVDDPVAGRRLLRELLPDVTDATEWVVPPAVTTNVALSAAGLARLGMAQELVDDLPPAFREGMARRAGRLGDDGPAAPVHWDPGLRDDTAHVLITLTAWRADRLDDHAAALATRIGRDPGLDLAHRQRAERFDDRREHFGFVDGIAQPRLAGIDGPRTAPTGTPVRLGWRSLPVGEFVLGHVDAEGVRSPTPARGWTRNGSFVVVRKLHQDVAAFRSLVRVTGADYPGGPDLLAAKLVGRWPDGTPLATSPDGPDPRIADDPARVNDFRFADDPEGLRCPVGAHVRRMNPRDGAGVGGTMTTRHRIIRRGLPYGPRLADDGGVPRDDGVDRGLLFVGFVADIERQFEFLQRRWAYDGDALRLGRDPDPLLGPPEPHDGARFKVPGAPPYLLPIDRPLVVLRGGGYFFQPGIAALTTLADGRT